MEIHLILENPQHFMRHQVEVLHHLPPPLTCNHHPIISQMTCFRAITFQAISTTAAFNRLTTIIISHLLTHNQCKTITIQIVMILKYHSTACIKTLVHLTTRTIIHIQFLHQTAIRLHQVLITIINGIISNLSEDV